MRRPGYAIQASDGSTGTLSIIQGEEGYVVFVVSDGEGKSIRLDVLDADAEAIEKAIRQCRTRVE